MINNSSYAQQRERKSKGKRDNSLLPDSFIARVKRRGTEMGVAVVVSSVRKKTPPRTSRKGEVQEALTLSKSDFGHRHHPAVPRRGSAYDTPSAIAVQVCILGRGSFQARLLATL